MPKCSYQHQHKWGALGYQIQKVSVCDWLRSRGSSHSINRLSIWFEWNLRGLGQVVFVNNPVSGLLILLALWIQSPWMGLMSMLGVMSSTFAAVALNLDRKSISQGIYGYNGVLVGVAIAALGLPGNGVEKFTQAMAIVFFAILTTIWLWASESWWSRNFRCPPLTLPFNLVIWLFLFWAKFVPEFAFGQQIETINQGIFLDVDSLTIAVFIGFGQIFLADKLLSGILVFLAIAYDTRIGAAIGLTGSIIGLLTGLILGAKPEDLYMGLWGYNSILTAIAIGGIFYVPNLRSYFVAGIAACFTAIMAQITAVLLGIWGLPSLTLPFCISTILVLIVFPRLSVAIPVSLQAIGSPEQNRQRHLAAKEAIAHFVFQLERLMLGKYSYYWLSTADTKIRANLYYVLKGIDLCEFGRVSRREIELYLHQTGQGANSENMAYLAGFIDLDRLASFNYGQFVEFVLRHEYLTANYHSLIEYLLPLDRCEHDLICFLEINWAITGMGFTPLTTMQYQLLLQKTNCNNWTWSQFIKVLLTA